ncbi:hypothetical protein R3P38DRAFT_3269397 [Favolaschia claudopus]|uniref:Uncharacterized protein n=1 Tax=Favolaschia claudopus TaxID=2862362 RepID=A0AAW0BH22_9AGAR
MSKFGGCVGFDVDVPALMPYVTCLNGVCRVGCCCTRVEDMRRREERLVTYGSTLTQAIIKHDQHAIWAIRLHRLALAIPDTHGLMIKKVWSQLPTPYKSQISPNYTSWEEFCASIASLKFGEERAQQEREQSKIYVGFDFNLLLVPLPWYKEPTAGNLEYDVPSSSQLAVRLTRYMPPSWRGIEPDRRYTANIPTPPDKAWEDPIPASAQHPLPSSTKPSTLHHSIHGDVLGPVAPKSLAAPLPARVKVKKVKASDTTAAASNTTVAPLSPPPKPRPTPKKPKAKDAKPKTNALLTSFGFTVAPNTSDPPDPPDPRKSSVAGVSSHLATFGVAEPHVAIEDCTEKDIDHSLYLRPRHLFPELDDSALDDETAFDRTGLQLKGILYDPRSIVLDMTESYLEIEPLLHTSPQIFQNPEFERIIRVPAKDRGYKVVLALKFCSHTLAFLSMDNLCYVYWLSVGDMELTRNKRVPNVLFEYKAWCDYTVQWLKEQDENPKWDNHSFAEILIMAGNHPTRAGGRYSLDELAFRAGIPLWMLWGVIRKNRRYLCAVYEAFFLFALERFLAHGSFFNQSIELNRLCGDFKEDKKDKKEKKDNGSYLLIATKEVVIRYTRMLSVYRQSQATMSSRKHRLVSRYNLKDDGEDAMKNAPWPFDLADLAPSLLLHGHMGPGIAENWTQLYREQAGQAVTKDMRENYKKMQKIPSLNNAQQLRFKPMPDMTPEELLVLSSTYGDTNPIVQYFDEKAKPKFAKLFGTQPTQPMTPSPSSTQPMPIPSSQPTPSSSSNPSPPPIPSVLPQTVASPDEIDSFDAQDDDIEVVDVDMDGDVMVDYPEEIYGDLSDLTDSEDEDEDGDEQKIVDPRSEIIDDNNGQRMGGDWLELNCGPRPPPCSNEVVQVSRRQRIHDMDCVKTPSIFDTPQLRACTNLCASLL